MQVRLAITVALIAGLAACSSEPPPAPQADGPGTYSYHSSNGASGQIEIPVPPSDPRVAEYEAYRKASGAGEATYAVVEVDNQSGKAIDTSPLVATTGEDGTTAGFEPITTHIDLWEKGSGMPFPFRDKIAKSIAPGAKDSRVLATTYYRVTSIRRVFIQPQGATDREVEAVKVG